MENALRSASPMHLELPVTTEYTIFHCEEDQAVNKRIHSDRFVEAFSKTHQVNYYPVPGRGHCDLTEEMWQRYHDAAIRAIEK